MYDSKQAEEKALEVLDLAEEKARRLLQIATENAKEKLHIDISRIPLICQSVIQIKEDISDIKTMVKDGNFDHESRIRVIEKNMFKWIGVLLIVPPLLTIGITLIINSFK